MASRVRSHTRKKPGGGTTKVTQHSRSGRPRKGLLSPGHAWALLKKARRANKRNKTTVAAVLALLGLAELVAWLTLQGTSLILVTFGMLALGVATLLGGLGGIQR